VVMPRKLGSERAAGSGKARLKGVAMDDLKVTGSSETASAIATLDIKIAKERYLPC